MQTDPPCIRARDHRRHATKPESKLWQQLRDRKLAGRKFRRQEPIGSYIVDFVCLESKLIVELDGGQHAHTEADDQRRSNQLQALGFRVLRFWNNEVLENIDGVVGAIRTAVSQSKT